MTTEEAIERIEYMICNFRHLIEVEDEEAGEMAVKALGKQMPKKVDDNDDPIETRFYLFTCPTCRYHLSEGMKYYKAYDYCPHCGQAIDWPEVG